VPAAPLGTVWASPEELDSSIPLPPQAAIPAARVTAATVGAMTRVDSSLNWIRRTYQQCIDPCGESAYVASSNSSYTVQE
jgi:hypothetical protein